MLDDQIWWNGAPGSHGKGTFWVLSLYLNPGPPNQWKNFQGWKWNSSWNMTFQFSVLSKSDKIYHFSVSVHFWVRAWDLWQGWLCHMWVELVHLGTMIDINNIFPSNYYIIWWFCLSILCFTKGNLCIMIKWPLCIQVRHVGFLFFFLKFIELCKECVLRVSWNFARPKETFKLVSRVAEKSLTKKK